MSALGTAALVFAFVLAVGVVVWILVFGILLFVDYERGMRMLGGLAMFVRSVKKKPAKEEPRQHRRSGDEEAREHRRRTPAPPTIRMFATPAPTRRSSDEKPQPPAEELES